MVKVMVFGTFDGIHKGHLDFFRQAKKYGDYLLAVVARDVNVKKIKNRQPTRNENERLEGLKKCDLIDQVLLGDKNDPYKLIENIKPAVICLGYDQSHFADNLENELRKRGLDIKVYRLKPYKPGQFHSSILNK